MGQHSWSWEPFEVFIAQATSTFGIAALYLNDLGEERSERPCHSLSRKWH